MKRRLLKATGTILMALVMAFCMTACGSSDSDQNSGEEGAGGGNFDSNKDKPFAFETVDFDGNDISLEDFADAELIMVNFWEPWCGPCVEEMPSLEKLYEEYSDNGFVIIGAFSSTDMDSEAKQIIENSNITYPIVRANDDMNLYMTDYYPTTFFIDSSGKVLSDEAVIGSQSYDAWEAMVKDYLGE